MVINDSTVDRFETKYKVGPNCWVWIASKVGDYGAFWYNNKTGLAHRFMWELMNGPIPIDKWILHSCDNPICVNPEHLFLGDAEDNALDRERKGRGSNQNSRKASCPKGHKYTEENTYINLKGSRECKECRKVRR